MTRKNVSWRAIRAREWDYNLGMRRTAFIAAFLAFSLVLSQAQMRGGGRVGAGSVRVGSAPRAAMPVSHGAGMHRPGSFGRTLPFSGFHSQPHPPNFHHHHQFVGSYYPWWYARFGYPAYYGAYYPFWGDWNSSSSYDDSQRYQDEAVARQIDDLSREVQRLREERDVAAATPAVAALPQQPHAEAAVQPDLPFIVVFLDGRTQQANNYAIVRETLWLFGNDRMKKVPLADVDLAATGKLNDARGLDFQVPGPQSGR